MNDRDLKTFKPGDIIGGRYEVIKYLGAGSMGLVYVCKHRELDGMLVALKMLFPEVALDPVSNQRFKNEIFASYDVFHKNVVRAYDYLHQDDYVAYTMEYVEGQDLADVIHHAAGEPLSLDIFYNLAIQICEGLQAIHDAGIVHRDLKPENILIRKDGVAKIADFGIARLSDRNTLTENGGVVGTINYLSPEYMLESKVDWRSDIYALGIILYEMLTSQAPFEGDSAYAIMSKRLNTDPPLPSKTRKKIPKELDQIIIHALQRDPDRRYQSAGEIARDLAAVQSGIEIPKLAFGGPKADLANVSLDDIAGDGKLGFAQDEYIELKNTKEEVKDLKSISSVSVNLDDINQRLRSTGVKKEDLTAIRSENVDTKLRSSSAVRRPVLSSSQLSSGLHVNSMEGLHAEYPTILAFIYLIITFVSFYIALMKLSVLS